MKKPHLRTFNIRLKTVYLYRRPSNRRINGGIGMDLIATSVLQPIQKEVSVIQPLTH